MNNAVQATVSALRVYAYETRSMRHDIALVEFAAAIDIVSSLVREAGRPAGSSGRTRSHVLPLGDLEGTSRRFRYWKTRVAEHRRNGTVPLVDRLFHWWTNLFRWWTNCAIGGQTVPVVDKLCHWWTNCAIGGQTVSAVRVDNQ